MNSRIFIICADWCAVCRDLKLSIPPWLSGTLSWVDLDEAEKILEGLDVENLPTLAVYRSDEWVFWGAVEPIWPVIQRISAVALAPVDTPTAILLTRLLVRSA